MSITLARKVLRDQWRHFSTDDNDDVRHGNAVSITGSLWFLTEGQ